MRSDGESSKPKFGTDATAKSNFDFAKGQSRDLPTPKNGTEASIGAPQTLEQGLQSVCKKAFELNKSEDQQQKLHNISATGDVSASEALAINVHERSQPRWLKTLKQIIERLDYTDTKSVIQHIQMMDSSETHGQNYTGGRFQQIEKLFDLTEADVERLKQIDKRLANSVPGNVEMIVSDFKDVTGINSDYYMRKSLDMIRKAVEQHQPVSRKYVEGIHAGMYGSTGASGSYYYMIRNNLPLKLPKHKENIAKAMIGNPTLEFQKALKDFKDTLDLVFPWMYWDSAGPAFGVKPKASLPDSVRLSLDEMKNTLEKKQKAVGEMQKRAENIISGKRWDLVPELVFGLESGAWSHLLPDEIEKALKEKQKNLQKEYQALQAFKDFLHSAKSADEGEKAIIDYIGEKCNKFEEQRKALIKKLDATVKVSQYFEKHEEERINLEKEMKEKKQAKSMRSRL